MRKTKDIAGVSLKANKKYLSSSLWQTPSAPLPSSVFAYSLTQQEYFCFFCHSLTELFAKPSAGKRLSEIGYLDAIQYF